MKLIKQFFDYKTLLVVFLIISSNLTRAENWPAWRGPRGDGTSLEKNVPTHWNSSSNVLWKTALPGVGHASPIVWGDRIFTVTALPERQERVLLCFERKNGEVLWQQTVLRAPLERKHAHNSYASSTPATDGQKVYATFLDDKNIVVAGYDFSGKQLWLVRPGTFTSPHGFCSSPVLYEDKVIVNCGNKGDSYVVALNCNDGQELWRIPQGNSVLSYSVPLIRKMAGRTQMVLCGDKNVAGYSPDDGSLYWIVNGPSEEFVATPVYNERAGLIFISSAYPKRHILAINPNGRGNVTQTHIAWRTTEGAPYVPSPIAVGDYFMAVHTSGVVYCYEAATGRILWKEKLGKQYSSPVLANGLVYFLNDNGVTNVVKPADVFVSVAQNDIGEETRASPVISKGNIFLRGDKHLFCISKHAN